MGDKGWTRRTWAMRLIEANESMEFTLLCAIMGWTSECRTATCHCLIQWFVLMLLSLCPCGIQPINSFDALNKQLCTSTDDYWIVVHLKHWTTMCTSCLVQLLVIILLPTMSEFWYFQVYYPHTTWHHFNFIPDHLAVGWCMIIKNVGWILGCHCHLHTSTILAFAMLLSKVPFFQLQPK